ncbi:MAG: acyltransferase domain-containing protein [Cyclobacteriaceae bacterium]
MYSHQSNIVFLFSGQGSHYRDMGKELYASNTVFKNSIDRADSIIYRNTGVSLVEELYKYDEQVFDNVLITHPAIVAVELAMTDVMTDHGIVPTAVAGVSLGEFSACAAAGIRSQEDVLIMSIEQAKLISRKVEEGGMTVVINPKNALLTDYLKDADLYDQCINFNGCFTVSGLKQALDRFDELLGENGIVYQRLDVEYPFHTPFREVVMLFWNHDESVMTDRSSKEVTMYSAMTHSTVDSSLSGDFFWDVISKPYDFPALVRQMDKDLSDPHYIDLGPSGTMATFMKYIKGTSTDTPVATAILTPHHQAIQKLENFQREIFTESRKTDTHRRHSKTT